MTSVVSNLSTTIAEPMTTATSQYDILDNHIKGKNISTIPITTSDGSTLYVAFKRNFIDNNASRRFIDIQDYSIP